MRSSFDKYPRVRAQKLIKQPQNVYIVALCKI